MKLKSMVMALATVSMIATYSGTVLAGETAQAALVESDTSASIIINQMETWWWNLNLAKTYYINAWDAQYPSFRCKGEGNGTCQSVPVAPLAPEPLDNQVYPIANNEQCKFFQGGRLIGTGTYTQTVHVSISSGIRKGNWRFMYTYNITPAGSGEVEPRTAWDLVLNNGAIPVNIKAVVNCQSVAENLTTKR